MEASNQLRWKTIQRQQKERVQTVQKSKEQYKERKNLIQQMEKMLLEHENEWLDALEKDLGKSNIEGYTSELAVLLNEIDYTLRHLKKWMKADISTRMKIDGLEKINIKRYPYGSVLIISPWNYPLQLSLMPLIGALASGNSCFIKPSEYAEATGQLLNQLIKQYFEPKVVTVIEGDTTVSQKLLELNWDFIFFTGSKRVGKIVHQQAAKNTTPVALELGGKNPCIIDQSGLSTANVQNIIWGKFLNAGQSCIAPDTVYVHEAIFSVFLQMAKETIQSFYGEGPKLSEDYGRIISTKHFDQLKSLFSEEQVYFGGRTLREDTFIEPTLLTDIDKESKIAQEEIFGPILPVIPYSDLSILSEDLNKKASPLVTYLFSESKKQASYIEQTLKSGSMSVNQVIKQAASPRIPFGGVGESGFGRYHGEESFKTFSYQKANSTKRNLMNMSLQYPPYHKAQLKWIKKFRRWLF